MNHHRICQESLHPLHDIEPVLPSHLDSLSPTLATAMQLGHHNIISQLMLIDACKPEELDGTITPAMNNHSSTSAASVDKECMMPLTWRHRKEGVSQGTYTPQAIHPLLALRISLKLLLIAGVGIHPVRIRRQWIVEHIKTATNKCHHKDSTDNNYYPDNLLHNRCKAIPKARKTNQQCMKNVCIRP